jgi:hypothetical protein
MPTETFPPARSALNLRLVLAVGGALLCLALGVAVVRSIGWLAALPLWVLAIAGAWDAVVVLRRRRQRAEAHRGADHRHDSLFE